MKLIPHYNLHPYYSDPALHLLYVNDQRRIKPFERAIKGAVSPGDVVVDIGTGSGIMALFAAEAGAGKVYAIERNEIIIRLAERCIEQAGFAETIVLIKGDCRDVSLPERADVITAEIIGGLGNDEGIIDIMSYASQNILKQGGMLIPNNIRTFIAPIDVPEMHAEVCNVYDQDIIVSKDNAFEPYSAYYQILNLPESRLLSEGIKLDDIELLKPIETLWSRSFEFKIKHDGLFSGFAVWLEACLGADIYLRTSPYEACTCWGQAYLPLREQCKVAADDIIRVTIATFETGGRDRLTGLRWAGGVKRGDLLLFRFDHRSPQVPG